MRVNCNKCGLSYDDADRDTGCPHDLIMAADDLAQKKAALELFGKEICFASDPNGVVHEIWAISYNGMVRLRDMKGEFAPHLFVVKKKVGTENT